MGRPGAFLVEPQGDTWVLDYRTSMHINHHLTAGRVRQTKKTKVTVRRFQVPLAPERVGTYQGQQGKTIRGADKEPLGHTIDLRRPAYMEVGEYKQHLYMILGRARSLDWCIFQNFPWTPEGGADWSLFETGPPDFLVHFFRVLEERAEATAPVVDQVRYDLCIFPPWPQRPTLAPDPNRAGRFLYDSAAWDEALEPRFRGHKRGQPKHPPESRKRLRGKQGQEAAFLRQQPRPLATRRA